MAGVGLSPLVKAQFVAAEEIKFSAEVSEMHGQEIVCIMLGRRLPIRRDDDGWMK